MIERNKPSSPEPVFQKLVNVEGKSVPMEGSLIPFSAKELLKQSRDKDQTDSPGWFFLQGLTKSLETIIHSQLANAHTTEFNLAGEKEQPMHHDQNTKQEIREIAEEEIKQYIYALSLLDVAMALQHFSVGATYNTAPFSFNCLKIGNLDNKDFTISQSVAESIIKTRKILDVSRTRQLPQFTVFDCAFFETDNPEDPNKTNEYPFANNQYMDALFFKMQTAGMMQTFNTAPLQKALFIFNHGRLLTTEDGNTFVKKDENNLKTAIHEGVHLADIYSDDTSAILAEGFATAVEFGFSIPKLKSIYETFHVPKVTENRLIDLYRGKNVVLPEEVVRFFTPAIPEMYFLSAIVFSDLNEIDNHNGIRLFYRFMTTGIEDHNFYTTYGKNRFDLVLTHLERYMPQFSSKQFQNDLINRINNTQ